MNLVPAQERAPGNYATELAALELFGRHVLPLFADEPRFLTTRSTWPR